jgi:hypothetical protein
MSDTIHFNYEQPYHSFDRSVGVEDMHVSTAERAQLRKPGAPGVLSLQVKYDPASRLKCNATLIDDIQYSRKSCHDKYEFRIVPFTISYCKLHFYHPKL